MSDRVEERRQAEIYDQKKLQAEKSQKEKDASAAKFKQTFQQKTTAEQKNTAQNQKDQSQKQFNQNLMMARNGIANRTVAERLVKGRDEDQKTDRDVTSANDKENRTEADNREDSISEARQEAQAQAQQFDAPVKNDEQNKDQQGQGQQQSQGQQGHQQGQQQQKDRDNDKEGTIGGIKAAKGNNADKAGESKSATKIEIGKTMKAAASERIAQPVLNKLVDSVAKLISEGMKEFQIQLKDDALGGGTLRVSLSDQKKLSIAFTLKDPSAKNLLTASKGQLTNLFEKNDAFRKKGITIGSIDIKLRGEA